MDISFSELEDLKLTEGAIIAVELVEPADANHPCDIVIYNEYEDGEYKELYSQYKLLLSKYKKDMFDYEKK